MRSAITEPSSDTPPKRPRVMEYEYIAASLPKVFTEPPASPLRPTGPTAMEKFPLSFRDPAAMNDF